ncbi:MAG: hypothetical protein MUC96_08065 [Myxococcaceae bacterium]|nr:hypothetical protein [Myxococcaceae bacterium]
MSRSGDGFVVRTAVAPVLPGPLAGLCPGGLDDRARWFFATSEGVVVGADLESGERFCEVALPFPLYPADRQPVSLGAQLCASPDGAFVAVAERRGLKGAVVDVAVGRVVHTFEREAYHPEHCTYPLAFVDTRRLIHGVAWNLLAVLDVVTGARTLPSAEAARFDYFFGALAVSPTGARLSSSGWVWQPTAVTLAFDVERVLRGEAPVTLGGLDGDAWDLPMCWLDDERVALFATDANHQGQLVIDDVSAANRPLRVKPCDVPLELGRHRDELLLLGDVTEARSVDTLEPAARLALPTVAWHPGAREALGFERPDGSGAWHLVSRPRPPGPLPASLVEQARRARAAGTREARLVLADALESAGLPGPELEHLRAERPHGARCHVVDDLAAG